MKETSGVKNMFTLIEFDGWNLGLKGDAWTQTWLEFDSFEDAQSIAIHWQTWCGGLDI